MPARDVAGAMLPFTPYHLELNCWTNFARPTLCSCRLGAKGKVWQEEEGRTDILITAVYSTLPQPLTLDPRTPFVLVTSPAPTVPSALLSQAILQATARALKALSAL
jgi:hypothetical protein